VNGISLAYKNEINSDWAWQLKFDADFDYHKFDYDQVRQHIYENNSLQNLSDTDERIDDNEGQSFTLSNNFLLNFYEINNFNSYVGMGPLLQYYRTRDYRESKSQQTDGSFAIGWSENISKNFLIGVSCIAGIEGKILSYLYIFAEYELIASYGWIESTYTSNSNSGNKYIIEYDGNVTQFELQNIKLGLILYL